MTLTLKLPRALEAELSAEAAELGLSLQEYALRLLAAGRTAAAPKNGAKLVEYWQREGVIGTRTDITDSQTHARKLRKQAERRK